jgi:signal peptidase I
MMLRLLKVRGHSLFPDFREGDYVLAAGVPFPSGKIRAGDVVIFRQPGYGTLIKRVQKVSEKDCTYEVRGTQVNSADSRNFGPISRDQITGKVIWHIRQK